LEGLLFLEDDDEVKRRIDKELSNSADISCLSMTMAHTFPAFINAVRASALVAFVKSTPLTDTSLSLGFSLPSFSAKPPGAIRVTNTL
jgi:hypothetical protein